ncbi:Hpt domain-containing protein [Halofilum ochraceum]|uniref:hybrid sensor histidine kinase/response regulator n=1 Tax=Halofilum ochraceum TaxID=1611323 RepID=UPI003CCBE914
MSEETPGEAAEPADYSSDEAASGTPPAAGQVEETATEEAGGPRGAGIDPGASGSSQLAILGEDADDEIVEVFVEEALGELDKINENLPRWKSNPGDEEALIVVRRAYHTLKGGGRLIGAELIGEFSWSMENMLNRVIDHSIDSTSAVSDTLDEAAAALPQLIEQLQGNRAPIAGIDDLIERAHALSRGEQGPPPTGGDGPGGGSGSGGVGQGGGTPGPGSASAAAPGADSSDGGGARAATDVTTQSALADDALAPSPDSAVGDPAFEEAAAAPAEGDESQEQSAATAFPSEPEEGVSDGLGYAETPAVADSPEPNDDSDLPREAAVGAGEESALESSIDDQAAPRQSAAHGGEPDARAETDGQDAPETHSGPDTITPHTSGDPLTDIFLREAAGHQTVLHRELGHAGDGTGAIQANDDVVRALHTLVGSAQTVEADTVADLTVRMERIVKAHQDQAYQLDAETVALFQETLARVDQALAALASGETVASDDLRARLDSVLEEVEQARAARDEGESELLDIFIEEGDEILETCDRAVANWREDPDDTRVIPDLQRGLHTLKGGARMANFPPIADLTHEVESLIDAVADGDCNLSDDVFDLLQEAVDALTVLLEQARNRNDVSRIDWLVDDLRTLREQRGGGADQRSDTTASDSGATAGAEAITEVEQTETGGDEPADEPEMHERPEAAESRASESAATTSPGSEQIRVQSELLDNLVNFAGEVSIYHSRINEQLGQYRFNIQEFDQTVNRLRAQLRDMENETESQIRYSHAVEREQEPNEGERDAGFDPLEFDRYTRLHELSRSLSESVGDLDSLKEILDNVTRDAETLLLQQSRVSSELQDGLMQTRMVRFDGLRARLARVVRQTASTVGKKVQMDMSGGELEVDRSIQERIVAPLEHVLRNAVSHGIESPEKRRANGKPEQGTIRLDLHRGGTDIVIDISDDGGGIDPAAIRRKGIEKGLIDADDERDDNEVIKLILETGFSTADEVTQISGRGVGMDVVDAEIRRLGGTLGIQTELGSGTRFTVRLPVTLAINQAVMVQAGDDTYAIPIASIEGVAQVTAGDLKGYYVDPSQHYHYAGNDYRVQHLGTLLGTSEPRLENEDISYPVIMIRAGDDRVALHVDGLVGRREVVVKPLGAPLNMLPGISGATIMADGAVVLILDIGGLLRTEERFVASVGPRLGETGDAEAVAGEEAAEDAKTAPTVLVVDDSITIRKVTNRILERNGITVATAKDGVDALSWMSHTVPDLILLDIEMPRMDGYEVATYVRGDERLAEVPIIMITSRTGEKHRERAEGIGVNRYLGKPYQETELMEHINAVLAEHAAADASA